MQQDLVGFARDGLNRIREEKLHGSDQPPPPDMLRGIDFYTEDAKLNRRFFTSIETYVAYHRQRPDLIRPTTFTEKQMLFKFFGPIPKATPSDKLRSPAYTPPDVRALARLPKRLFVFDEAALPDNDAIPPGSYFYKSNHSSGTNMRIRFPMDTAARETAIQKAQAWLRLNHSARLGLWWYRLMPRNVFIEEDLGSDAADAPDWKFFVCNGRVELFQVDVDRSRNHIQTLYDRNGTFLPHELYYKSGTPVAMPAQLDDMIRLAEAIGRNFDFIRVDMFLKGDTIFLGEIGLVPNGATTRIRSRAIDERLGAAWTPPWLGQVAPGFPTGHYARMEVGSWDWGS